MAMLLFCFTINSSNGQDLNFNLAPENGVEVYVTGGSTLHDWTARISDVAGYPLSMGWTSQSQSKVDVFEFSVGVESMTGGRGPTMDKKIREALKFESHPRITYVQNEPAPITWSPNGSDFSLVSKGLLNIAGVEKAVEVTVSGRRAEGMLIFEGAKSLLMSDYGIEPPTAMFGQIKTKDDITFHFRFAYHTVQ